MERTSVESSVAISVGYDPEEAILEVEFTGGVYRYFDVPPFIFEALMESQSKGGFIAKYIRDRYNFERL